MPDLIPVDHDPFNDPPTNLIPVDHDPWENVPRDPGTNRPLITIPRTAEGVVAKPGQAVQNPDVAGDIAAMPNKAAATVGDMLGVNDAMRAIRGELTPEEAQTFAMGAATMMLGGPEAKAAQEAAPLMRNLYRGESVYNKGGNFWTTDPEWARQFTQSGLESEVAKKAISEKHIYQPPSEVYAGDPDAVDQAIADARKGGYHAVELSEGQGQPNSLFVFNKRALQPFQEPPQPQGIRAYHGSPYDFNQFDLSKIGTGEGAQAYGHGLYFAENPATANQYKLQTSKDTLRTPNGDIFNPSSLEHLNVRVAARDNGADLDATLNRAQELYDSPSMPPQTKDMIARDMDKLRTLKAQGGVQSNSGKTYEVNINADPEHFLDWDKPLSEQHPIVQQKLNEAWLAHPEAHAHQTGAEIYNNITSALSSGNSFTPDAGTRTEILRDAGIPGIKYLDQGSRGKTTWSAIHPQGGVNDFPNEQQARAFVAKNPEYSLQAPNQTSNYVVFNDKLIDIVKKYGLAGLVAGGASHFSTQPVDHNPFQ